MKELLAKGVIEELATEEEVEIDGGILEVAEICNQNHFSGINNLWLLLCTNANAGRTTRRLPFLAACRGEQRSLPHFINSLARSFEKRALGSVILGPLPRSK